jgi:hypothetical protein
MSDLTMNVSEALEVLKRAMQNDSGFAWGWHCNIAVTFQDEGGSHRQANEAAARFMRTCFGVDVTKFDQWKEFDWWDIPLAEWADCYEGPWVLTTSHEGYAGYGVNYGPKKTALYFESHEALCEYWDSVKHLPRGVKCQVDSFPLRRVR